MKKWLHVAAIDKAVSVHGLHHAFATHLLEDGANIFTIKELLGHSSISSTTIYLHLVNPRANVMSPADRLYDGCGATFSTHTISMWSSLSRKN